ncbi:MAG: GNAT family N-acetyltransferase [Proteobacteria bacterium]|nr:GNAT family N-acetyltransferase [Pseudomonadota bacterium]
MASNLEELMQVFSIRSAVFMTEQRCPYHEEFDGNDFSASHIVAYCDREPAATIRLRYFSGFAKIERMAVRNEFRGYATINPLIRYTLDLAQTKGYTKFLGHAQKRLVRFWSRYGFIPKGDIFQFSDHEYLTIVADFDAIDSPLTRESEPMMLTRPEGQWDKPGILEFSSERAPTNPL